ncbi:MAG: hypothetical protein MI784_00945 [Cytophagales bacterium]|nr:hypothetical protein [Cytophagales bacterium]
MIYKKRKNNVHASSAGSHRKSASRIPPGRIKAIQCLFFKAEDVEKLKGIDESRRKAIAGCLRLLEENEKEIEYVRQADRYLGALRERLLRERLELLIQTETLFLHLPLSHKSKHRQESEKISDWFDQVYNEREELMGWLRENTGATGRSDVLKSITDASEAGFRLENAWELLHRWFPEDIEAFEALPGVIEKKYSPLTFGPPFYPKIPELQTKENDSNRTGSFYLETSSSKAVRNFPGAGRDRIMPNYLYLYWNVLSALQKAQRFPEVSLSSELSSLREDLLSFSSLDYQYNSFFPKNRKTISNFVSEKPMNLKAKMVWSAVSFSRPLLSKSPSPGSLLLAESNLASADFLEEALCVAKRPYLLEASKDKLHFSWDVGRRCNLLCLSDRVTSQELAQLFFMQRFFELTSESSRVFPWRHLPSENEQYKEFKDELTCKEFDFEASMRKNLKMREKVISGWELQQAWNRQHKNASVHNSLMWHSFYAFNEWKNRTRAPSFTSGSDMLIGLFPLDLMLNDLESKFDEIDLSETSSYWEALGEAIMQSILLGNWADCSESVDGSLPYGSQGRGPVMSSPLQVRCFSDTGRYKLFHQWPRMSLEGYCVFMGKGKNFVEEIRQPEEAVSKLKSEIKEHLLDLLTFLQEAKYFIPYDRLAPELKWPYKFENFFNMLSGMHQVLLNIYRNYKACEQLALRAQGFFPSAPYSIFMELLATVPKVMDEIGFGVSLGAQEERLEALKGSILYATPLSAVQIRHGTIMEELYPVDTASFIPVMMHGRKCLQIVGTLTERDLETLREHCEKEKVDKVFISRSLLAAAPLLPDSVKRYCVENRIKVFLENDRGFFIQEQ